MQVSLTRENLNLDRLKFDSGVPNIRLDTPGLGHIHIYPTFVGGKQPRKRWTREEQDAISQALESQGFTTTLRAVNKDYTTRLLELGTGFRIYGYRQ